VLLAVLAGGTAAGTTEDPAPEPWTWTWFADWAIGTPVRIAAILVGAWVLRWVLHRSVNGLVARAGVAEPPKRLFGSRRAASVLVGTTGLYSERRAQRARTLASLTRSIISAVVYTVAGIMVLTELGFNVAPLLASAGIAGVALGFGAQSLVKDFINGIFMLAEDQYGVGDLIDMGQATGIVEGVGLRVTRLRDADGAVWFVRNGEVLRVANKSQGWSRATVDVLVLPSADLDRVRALLREVGEELAAEPAWAERLDGRPEVLGLEHVAGETATVRLTVKTKPLQGDAVARELRERAYRRLEAAGVPLPGSAATT
jgi:small conductance mechanosensitive channel